MIITVSKNDLAKLAIKQVDNLFGYEGNLELFLDETLERLQKCFSSVNSKYYYKNGELVFSPFHSVQYSIFLYFLANTAYRQRDTSLLATKLYYLNKALNSVDWYYEVELPEIFCAEHPVGSVVGRGVYSNRFFIYQNCTVGGNKGKYPVLGENVIMFAGSSVIGNSSIGNNVFISASALVKDEDIPDNCVVFGQSPNLTIKRKDKEYMSKRLSHFFNDV